MVLLTVALSAIPVLIGMFVAAPLLAREYEAGTFRFAWTQPASRTRWVVAKLVLPGAALTAASCAFGALVSWWLTQADPLGSASRWQPAQFGLTAVTFAAWTVAAFAAGMFGALVRRTVPAMAATGAFVAALTAITYHKLDTLLISAAPVTGRTVLLNLPVYQPGSPPVTFLLGQAVTVSAPAGSLPLRSWIAGPHGQIIGSLPARVLALSTQAENRWLASNHLTLWTAYQPADRFWLFQSAEGAAGLMLAVILGTRRSGWYVAAPSEPPASMIPCTVGKPTDTPMASAQVSAALAMEQEILRSGRPGYGYAVADQRPQLAQLRSRPAGACADSCSFGPRC